MIELSSPPKPQTGTNTMTNSYKSVQLDAFYRCIEHFLIDDNAIQKTLTCDIQLLHSFLG